MQEFSQPLGDAVKKARGELGLTQNQVADQIDVDVRTVMNIENYKGNPKMEILFPLIRALKIDSREIFHPEIRLDNPAVSKLHLLIEQCSEDEAAALIPIYPPSGPAIHPAPAVYNIPETISVQYRTL